MLKLLILFLSILSMTAYAANQNDLLKLQNKIEQKGLDLSHADLRKYQFHPDKVDLQHANLSYADLSGVNLSKMNLSHANLSHAKLSNTVLIGADLSHANLSYATLTN